MRNCGLKRVLVETSTTPWVHSLSKFIGSLLFYKLYCIIDPCNHGLYHDDGLIIVDDCTPRKGDIRKKIISVV